VLKFSLQSPCLELVALRRLSNLTYLRLYNNKKAVENVCSEVTSVLFLRGLSSSSQPRGATDLSCQSTLGSRHAPLSKIRTPAQQSLSRSFQSSLPQLQPYAFSLEYSQLQTSTSTSILLTTTTFELYCWTFSKL
jgi:hypothetical protein